MSSSVSSRCCAYAKLVAPTIRSPSSSGPSNRRRAVRSPMRQTSGPSRVNGAPADARHDLQYSHRMPTLTFLGAAGTVTGSKHLLDLDGHRVLVDCGLFQGLKELRERNWAALPIDPRRDRRGRPHPRAPRSLRLPAAAGRPADFAAASSARRARSDLCTLVLPDSAHIQEEDARQANRHGYSKHTPALPLYTELDAARDADAAAAGRLRPSGAGRARRRGRVHQRRPPARVGVRAHPDRRQDDPVRRRSRPLRPAGAAGSDAGRRAPTCCSLESTYGDRLHEPDDGGARLAAIINETVQRGGKLIIPSFADRPRRGGALLAASCSSRASGFRCCRSTSTARWRPARCSSTPQRVQRARSRHETGRAGRLPCSAPRA